MIRNDLVEKIKEELCVFFGKDLLSIVLFGSYAEGKETPYSDIDILIITDHKFTDWRERRTCEVKLRKTLYEAVGQVSPKVVSFDDLKRSLEHYNPLLLNILNSGIPILDRGAFSSLHKEFERLLSINVITHTKEHWVVTG